MLVGECIRYILQFGLLGTVRVKIEPILGSFKAFIDVIPEEVCPALYQLSPHMQCTGNYGVT